MNDDFNSPILIANLFDGVRLINSINDGKETVSTADLVELKKLYHSFIFDVLGLKEESAGGNKDELAASLMNAILEIRKEVRAKKDFTASDLIRDELKKINIVIKDTKDGAVWEQEK